MTQAGLKCSCPTSECKACVLVSYMRLLQVDAATAEEQKVIAYSDKTDIGRVMMNDDTRSD